MSSDLRLIRLCRKTNGKENIDITEEQQYLSTDYFDVMYCIEKKFDEDFPEIMGIDCEFERQEDEIAVQTYSLFCCQDIIEKYKGDMGYGDPFHDTDNDKIYLSVMQVHVAPEFISRSYKEFNSANELLSKIEEDIHKALNEFVEKRKATIQNKICYRVYRLLSTGDFAVAIRSSEAEISFNISNTLRKRYVLENDGNGKKLVLYKTFTLLTVSKKVVPIESDGDSVKNNIFVIRCCYSKNYWSEKDKVEQVLLKNSIFPDVYSLPGRYDFSIYLSEHEFKQIFQYLLVYKNMLKKEEVSQTIEITNNKYSPAVRYMIYLLENRYLSQVNERYLICNKLEASDESSSEGNISNEFGLVEKREFLEERNTKLYKRIDNKYLEISKNINAYAANRQAVIYYMNLLGKLLLQCQTINNLSDTRNYATVLLKYIQILLNSLNAYYEYMIKNKEDKVVILDLIEEYLKESVAALDIYSQYIRNNNLQSLQTPNYNIESNTSMEKLLIAFSEIVYTCINDYSQCDTVREKELGLKEKKYYPIIVPDLRSRTLGIEMMFPKWNIYSTESSVNETNEYLLVTFCPTLKELGNVAVSIAALYHEAAHHLRYEKREDRNKNVVTYSLAGFSEELVGKMQQECTKDQNFNRIEAEGILSIRDALYETILDYLQATDDKKKILEQAPLTYIEAYVIQQIDGVLFNDYYEIDVCVWVNYFLRKILKWLDGSNEVVKNVFPKIDEELKKLVNLGFERKPEEYVDYQSKEHREWHASLKKLWKLVVMLFVAVGSELTESKKEWEAYWSGIDIETCEITELYNKKTEAFKHLSGDENKELLEQLFLDLFNKLITYGMQYEKLLMRHNRSIFLEKLYEKCCEKWKENIASKIKKSKNSLEDIQYINEVGRYYGIDYKMDNNKEIFLRRTKEILVNSKKYGYEKIKYDIACYREITADFFMCILMGLEPLGYINVIAQKMRIEDEIPKEYIERMSHVIVTVWCDLKCGDLESLNESFFEICGKVFADIVKYVKMMKLDNYYWGEDTPQSINELVKQIKKFLVILTEHPNKKELRDALNMTRIVHALITDESAHLLWVYSNDSDKYRSVLKSDYCNGKAILESVRQEFATKNKALDIISYLNKPWIKYDEQEMADINLKAANLILEMYYENKCRNSVGVDEDDE